MARIRWDGCNVKEGSYAAEVSGSGHSGLANDHSNLVKTEIGGEARLCGSNIGRGKCIAKGAKQHNVESPAWQAMDTTEVEYDGRFLCLKSANPLIEKSRTTARQPRQHSESGKWWLLGRREYRRCYPSKMADSKDSLENGDKPHSQPWP